MLVPPLPVLAWRGIRISLAALVIGGMALVSLLPAGAVSSPPFVGWLGGCSGGANCDNTNSHSLGFACTAATCVGVGVSGSGDGQLSSPSGLAVNGSNL